MLADLCLRATLSGTGNLCLLEELLFALGLGDGSLLSLVPVAIFSSGVLDIFLFDLLCLDAWSAWEVSILRGDKASTDNDLCDDNDGGY